MVFSNIEIPQDVRRRDFCKNLIDLLDVINEF